MANLRISLTHKSSGSTVQVEIMDVPGINNKWKSLTSGAWNVDGGSFTNLFGKATAESDGVLGAWVLDDFDLDEVAVNSKGSGESYDGGGSFPPGVLNWVVLKVF